MAGLDVVFPPHLSDVFVRVLSVTYWSVRWKNYIKTPSSAIQHLNLTRKCCARTGKKTKQVMNDILIRVLLMSWKQQGFEIMATCSYLQLVNLNTGLSEPNCLCTSWHFSWSLASLCEGNSHRISNHLLEPIAFITRNVPSRVHVCGKVGVSGRQTGTKR